MTLLSMLPNDGADLVENQILDRTKGMRNRNTGRTNDATFFFCCWYEVVYMFVFVFLILLMFSDADSDAATG